MTSFDLVVRNGEIHDGAGGSAFTGDVGIQDGRITAIGKFPGAGREEINAEDQIVTPGFVDVHTHYDGQATWENRLIPSSNHGVTTVVMGNCGVGFAPCRPHQHDMLIELMEGVEDIPEVVMATGLPWNWETFPEYLSALERRTLDIDIAAQVPHSALRVYVMGERGARKEAPTAEDLEQMRALTAEAVRAGALGVSTSRNIIHRTRAGALAPSLHSEEDEFIALADGLRDAGAGVYQIIPEVFGDIGPELKLMRKIAEASGRPLSFTLLQPTIGDPENWRNALRFLERVNADGLEIKAQVFPRPVGYLFGLDLSFHPFCLHPSFQPLLNRPLAERVQAMRDPAMRARLLAEQPEHTNSVFVKTTNSFRFAYALGDPPNYEPNPKDQIQARAQALGLTPHEYAYDLLLENEGRMLLYLPGANYRDFNLDAARAMEAHPHTILGLGDGGAHYGMICDASFPTSYLQSWVRDARPEDARTLPHAIQSLSDKPARAMGLNDRGRIAIGYKADINIIDLSKLRLHAPSVAYDLPAAGRRLRQGADGYVATIKSGAVTYKNGEPTGALPGRLVRGAQAAPA